MPTQPFVNKKLDFVEELLYFTDSHIFLTGKAGTGKTTFLRSIRANSPKHMVVVAPTGVAAINAGGQTIHSFFQLPFGPQLPDDVQRPKDRISHESVHAQSLAAQFQKINKKKLKIMRGLELLVIDEISMVRADVLDAIDAVLRRTRRSTKAFGGVQLLMIGDVHQLAPVARQEDWNLLSAYYKTPYFFGSHVLQRTSYLCVELDHIFRQHDQDFIDLLNKVRDNRIDKQCLDLLNTRYHPDFEPGNDDYITLTTHNYQADEINESNLEAIDDTLLHFKAEIKDVFPENSYPTKEDLELKIGAQVMFVKNDTSNEKEYYNGKIGCLVGYDNENNTLQVRCNDKTIHVAPVKWENYEYSINAEKNAIEETVIGSFTQMPLRLAWAITIHKSQGMTFDKIIVDAGRAFAHGQVYVALSRCTNIEGLVLKTKITSSAIVNDHSVDRFVECLPELEPNENTVSELRHRYELDCMMELFDFSRIYHDCERLSRIVLNNSTLFEDIMIQEFSKRRTHVFDRLCQVSVRFEGQVRQLHAQCQSCEENETLQKRLTQAIAYFNAHLEDITSGFFELPFKTDNQAVNEQISEALTNLQEDVALKTACLDACKDNFDVKTYCQAKAERALKAEKQTKKAIVLKDNMMNHNILYKKLVAWRQDVAEERGIAATQIAPNQVLKSIVKEKPVNQQELRHIKGMGTLRSKLYGEAIINIVLESLGQKTIEEVEETEPEPRHQPAKGTTYAVTKQMLDSGMTIHQIAKERQLSVSTIENHVARFISEGAFKATDFVAQEKHDTIKDYFESTNDRSLGTAKDVLGEDYSYCELRFVLSELDSEGFFHPLHENNEQD